MINCTSTEHHCKLRIGTGNYSWFWAITRQKSIGERESTLNSVPRIHRAKNKVLLTVLVWFWTMSDDLVLSLYAVASAGSKWNAIKKMIKSNLHLEFSESFVAFSRL